MHVFVTGGTGLVGIPVVTQLIAAGHTVTALARSDASVAKLTALGATTVRGTHLDLDVISKAAGEADATIHLAFNHELMAQFPHGPAKACEEDFAAITAMCDAMVASGKSGKTFIASSGILGTAGEDEKSPKEINPHLPRYLSDNLTHSYGEKGVRTVVIRLPPIVHGPAKEHTFIAVQIKVAKETGVAGYVGDGSKHWPSVHTNDAAALYVLALNKGPSGMNLHPVQENIPVKEIAEFIAAKLGVGTKSIPDAQAASAAGYGFVGMVTGMGGRATTVYTQEWTGWKPKEYGLFEELENYTYEMTNTISESDDITIILFVGHPLL